MASERELLHVLQHALGLDDYGRGHSYRNRFVTGEGTTDYHACMAHVQAGRMIRREPSELTGGDYCFSVTDIGKQYVQKHSKEPTDG